MLCQKCGLNEATVHREQMVLLRKFEEHLCQLCAGTGASIGAAGETSVSGKGEAIFVVNHYRMQGLTGYLLRDCYAVEAPDIIEFCFIRC